MKHIFRINPFFVAGYLILSLAAENILAQQNELQHAVNTYHFSVAKKWKAIAGFESQKNFSGHPEYGILPPNASCEDCYEDLSQRTESSRYFVTSTGDGFREFSLQQSYGALHYKDAAGNWISYDNRLRKIAAQQFSVNDPEFPIEINTQQGNCKLTNGSEQLLFNNALELLMEQTDGQLISLGRASWTDFTAGDQGVLVKNCWPGIDMQMLVYRGSVKTNFIINRPLDKTFNFLRLRDHLDFKGQIKNQGIVYASGETIELTKLSGETLFNIGVLAVYDQHQLESGLEFPYEISANTIDMKIPGVWLNDPGRAYPVIIDPLVTASNTRLRASIFGSKFSTTCWDDYCGYDMDVPVPPNCTVTDALFSIVFRANSPCVLRNGGMRFATGSCLSPNTGNWWSCTQGFPAFQPGTCEGINYSFFGDIGSCFRPPQCQSYNMPIQFRFARCGNDTRSGCVGECIGAETNWKVEIRGRTLEVHPSQPLPLPPITQTICSGSSANIAIEGIYGVPPYTYAWSPGGQTGPTISVNPTTNTTYTATITDQCGNTATKNFNVLVTQASNPDFTINPNPTCINTPITFTGNGSAGASAYDWILTGSSNPAINNQKTFSAQYSAPGTYDVTLNYQQGSCVFPITKQVEILAPGQGPSVTITSNPPMPICNGVSVTYTATADNAGVNPVYQWTVNNNPVGTNSPTFTASNLVAGDVVRVTITANLPCINPNTATSAPYPVSISPPTTPSVSVSMNPSTPVCPGADIIFTATPVDAGSSPTYQWTVNNQPAGTGGATFTANNLPNGAQVRVTVTSNSPCSSTPNATSQPVSVNLLPEKIPSVLVNISPDGAVCEGTSVSFTAVPTNGGTTPTYTWKVNGVPVSGVNGPSFGSSSLKNGDKVSVDMLSSEACPGPNPVAVSTDVTMSILPKVIPSVSIVSSPGNDICSGTSVTFTATPVNGGTAPGLQWFINGNPAAGANSTTFTSSTLNNGDLITLRVQSNAQCPDPASVISDPIEMKVDPTTSGTVTIASAQNLPVCEGTALNFTATGNNLGPTPVYTWLINGNTSGTNSSTFSIPAPVNSDVVQLRVQPDGRCFSSNEVLSNQITLQILPNQAPSVSITATPSDTVCKNSYTIQFTAIPVNGGTTPSYSWKLNNVSDGSDASTYTNAFFKAGDIVEVEMTSNYQCKTNPTAKSNKIEIKGHTPILADAGIEQVICRDQTVTLNASATGGKNGPKDYRWTPGNLSGNPVTVTPEVSTTYLVEVSDQCGSFLAYDSVRVVVNPKPSADFNWNPFEPILMLTPEVRFNNPNVIPVTRQWDFGDGSTSTDANPIHIFEKRGLYSVTLYVTSEQGCKDSKTALLNVKDIFVFYIPNSFTPNGDGLNDRFTFYFNDSIPFTIDVFNRWGQLVYSGNEKSEFWDGRDPLTGDYVQDDVYIYRLVYRRKGLDGEQPRITLNGHVTVLKNIED